MLYFIVVLLLIGSYLVYRWLWSKNSVREFQEKIRSEWGGRKKASFNFDHISRYAVIRGGGGFHRLTGQTLLDMDFHEVFQLVDRTNSNVGQQYLYNRLMHPTGSLEALRLLDEDAEYFRGAPEERLEIQKKLRQLSHNDAYYIVALLKETPLVLPRWFNFVYVSLILLGGFLLLSIVEPVFLILALLPLAANMFVHYWNKENIFHFIRSIPQLSVLVQVSREINRRESRFHRHGVEEAIKRLKGDLSQSGMIDFFENGTLKGELAQLVAYCVELLKAAMLIEVFALIHVIGKLQRSRESIDLLFEYIGEIDVALSVASLRAGKLKTCKPELTADSNYFAAKEIYHPLIENSVPNDVLFSGKGILLTGSNMSGKTTLLRSILINSVLAQTIYTCFAERFESSVLKQFSSIRVDDNIFEGKSFYFEEVNQIGRLVQQAAEGGSNIFVIDEVFKGTNTLERVSAAKAILSYLNQGDNLVIVSTHDLELTFLLETEYELFHFSETIEGTEMTFDFKLKKGSLKTRNGIRIMEHCSFPQSIIREAERVSMLLGKSQLLQTPIDSGTE
jgi:hypothetical protein